VLDRRGEGIVIFKCIISFLLNRNAMIVHGRRNASGCE
jgi:hypothetical protein